MLKDIPATEEALQSANKLKRIGSALALRKAQIGV